MISEFFLIQDCNMAGEYLRCYYRLSKTSMNDVEFQKEAKFIKVDRCRFRYCEGSDFGHPAFASEPNLPSIVRWKRRNGRPEIEYEKSCEALWEFIKTHYKSDIGRYVLHCTINETEK
jgi:hypothetical protein